MRAAEPVGDPHGELGISPGATERQVKEAYRRLAARWHPDRNAHPRAAERMARINQAYHQILRRAAGPSAHPHSPAPPTPPAPAAPPPAASAEPPASPGPKPRPWWERDWTGARWVPDGPPRPPQGLLHTARLSLEQAAFGCTHEIQGEVADACSSCGGSGRLRATRSDCRRCSGKGQARLTPRGSLQPCPDCGGDGIERRACDACAGLGLDPALRSYHFEVRIPGGLREGQSVELRRQGQRSGTVAGDIEVAIELLPHSLFHFDDQHRLACRVPVDLYAQLGEGTAEVPALEGGSFALDLAGRGPGCPPQEVPGRGYPQRDGSRGPLMVHLQTVAPEDHTAAQRKLLRQLAEDRRAGGYRHSPVLADWQRQLARGHTSGSKP